MTTYLSTCSKALYLDQSINDAPVQGWWFQTILVYGPFGKERMLNKVVGKMPQKPSRVSPWPNSVKAGDAMSLSQGSCSADMAYPRKPVSTKEEALEGIRPVEWERLKKSLEPKRDTP